MGRWISEDPIGFAAGDTNVVRYVGNDTASFRDSTGLTPEGAGAAEFGCEECYMDWMDTMAREERQALEADGAPTLVDIANQTISTSVYDSSGDPSYDASLIDLSDYGFWFIHTYYYLVPGTDVMETSTDGFMSQQVRDEIYGTTHPQIEEYVRQQIHDAIEEGRVGEFEGGMVIRSAQEELRSDSPIDFYLNQGTLQCILSTMFTITPGTVDGYEGVWVTADVGSRWLWLDEIDANSHEDNPTLWDSGPAGKAEVLADKFFDQFLGGDYNVTYQWTQNRRIVIFVPSGQNITVNRPNAPK